jgi:hypothetical protein
VSKAVFILRSITSWTRRTRLTTVQVGQGRTVVPLDSLSKNNSWTACPMRYALILVKMTAVDTAHIDKAFGEGTATVQRRAELGNTVRGWGSQNNPLCSKLFFLFFLQSRLPSDWPRPGYAVWKKMLRLWNKISFTIVDAHVMKWIRPNMDAYGQQK